MKGRNNEMAKELLMTQEGYEDLVKELENLKTNKRAEISEKIKVARGFGDLSENSEYDEAKNEQAIVEARIVDLEQKLKQAKIIDKSTLQSDVVNIGSIITLRDIEFDDTEEYKIVNAIESHGDMNTITDESPVGKAVMGHKIGDTISVTVPSGAIVQYELIKIQM